MIANAAAVHALKIDDTLAEAYVLLGFVSVLQDVHGVNFGAASDDHEAVKGAHQLDVCCPEPEESKTLAM